MTNRDLTYTWFSTVLAVIWLVTISVYMVIGRPSSAMYYFSVGAWMLLAAIFFGQVEMLIGHYYGEVDK